MKHILLLPHIKIQNANALPSPYTIGFPAMTAWLGGTHTLQRLLNQQGFPELKFNSVAVCCHSIQLHTFKEAGGYEMSIIGTRNPLKSNGEPASFIAEARCHLTVSLVIEYTGPDALDKSAFIAKVGNLMHSRLKLSGGDILKFHTPQLLKIEGEDDQQKLIRKLMPGHVLIERRDLMQEAMGEGQDALEALLGYLKVMHRSEQDEEGSVAWTSKRKVPGWIVPIATGFQGLTSLGIAENQIDANKPHRFAESVVTLGEFVMPYRIQDLDHMLWHYHADVENDLYLCQQNKQLVGAKG